MTTINRFLFVLLVATIVIPLPAMTPALFSRTIGAMSLVSASRAEPIRFVPVYFLPTRLGHRPPAMVPDTVLLGIGEPQTIINEIGGDQGLAFDEMKPIPVVSAFDRPTPFWGVPIGRPVGFRNDVQVPSAVPEPATWAMLILGFMLAGTFLRRRQHSYSRAIYR